MSHETKNTENLTEYVTFLKEKGFSGGEVMAAISIKTEGVTMTRCIERFTRLYDNAQIDGFPDSSIEVLQGFYGYKALKKMKAKTLESKVKRLQSCLTPVVDEDFIRESVAFYLS